MVKKITHIPDVEIRSISDKKIADALMVKVLLSYENPKKIRLYKEGKDYFRLSQSDIKSISQLTYPEIKHLSTISDSAIMDILSLKSEDIQRLIKEYMPSIEEKVLYSEGLKDIRYQSFLDLKKLQHSAPEDLALLSYPEIEMALLSNAHAEQELSDKAGRILNAYQGNHEPLHSSIELGTFNYPNGNASLQMYMQGISAEECSEKIKKMAEPLLSLVNSDGFPKSRLGKAADGTSATLTIIFESSKQMTDALNSLTTVPALKIKDQPHTQITEKSVFPSEEYATPVRAASGWYIRMASASKISQTIGVNGVRR